MKKFHLVLRRLAPLSLAACVLASCGGGGGGSPKPPAPAPAPEGFNLAGFGSDLKNTTDKDGFMKKAKKASQLAQEGKSKFVSESPSLRADGSGVSSLALEISNLEDAIRNPMLPGPAVPGETGGSDELSEEWASFAEGQGEMNLDFGTSFGEAETCADAVSSIRKEYENTLSMVKTQFALLKQIEALPPNSEGFQPVAIPNRALAYSFSDQGMTGTIEGAADDSRILVKMTMAGQMNDMSDPTMAADMSAKMKMDVGFVANLETEVIDVLANMETSASGGQSMILLMEGRIAGGDTPQLLQKMKATIKNSEKVEPSQFDMTLSVTQVASSDLEVRLQSSGINSSDMTVPAFDETIVLKTQSDGSCSLQQR